MNESRAPAVWQVSGGPVDRPYSDLFLTHGVALIGPGDGGPWHPERSGGDNNVRRFAEDLRLGDLILLRSALAQVTAVGLVAGDYEFFEPFDDVQGWDLRHGRRVRWCRLPEAYRFERSVFGANPRRFARVQNDNAVAFAHSFLASGLTHWQEAPLPALPVAEPLLEDVPEALRDVVGLARDLIGLYGDEERLGDSPNENEMTAHFVVPFLRALGWPQELIAVEWRRIDVALFASLPRSPANCRFVIEVKRLGTGLEGARKQAEDYVAGLGISRDVVVTDGFRYRVFDHENDFAPVAYANLARLKQLSMALFDRLRRPQGV